MAALFLQHRRDLGVGRRRAELEAAGAGRRQVVGDFGLDLGAGGDALFGLARGHGLALVILGRHNFAQNKQAAGAMSHLRKAIRQRRTVDLVYTSARQKRTERTVRPLCLTFFAPIWLLTAWCELRDDFRNFRIDRIDELTATDQTFEPEPGKTCDDFMEQIRSR